MKRVNISMLKQKLVAVLTTVLLLTGLLAVGATPVAAAGYPLPEDITLHASAAILVNLAGNPEQDMVLFEKDADGVHAPGAMMRYAVLGYALSRIQEKGLDIDAVTGTYTKELDTNYVTGTGVPTANMKFGETWKLRDLLAVSFMQNACDAVAVLAVAVDGSVETFITGMNGMVDKLGCDYTQFVNLTGLDNLRQYTTPRDMYRIVRYCQSFSLFEDVAAQYQVQVTPVSGGTKRTFTTVNSLLQSSSQYHYDPVVHGRTGLSEHEGRTCASVARDAGYEYLVVVMGCPEKNDEGKSGLHYRDTAALFKWAFNQFEYKTVLGNSAILTSVPLDLAWETDRINLIPEKEIATVVDAKLDPNQIIHNIILNAERVTAPVQKGQVLGKVELIINTDQKIGEVALVAGDTVNSSTLLVIWQYVKGFFSSFWLWFTVVALLVLLIAYIILNIVYNRRRRRRRQRVSRR